MNTEKTQKTVFKKNTGSAICYSAADIDLNPGAKCGPMIRDVFLVECCTNGYGTITVNENTFPITPRSAYFLFPGDMITHTADKVQPREGYYTAFWGAEYAGILKRAGISSENPFAPPEAFDEICKYTKALYDMRDENDVGADLRRTAHLYSILGALLRSSEQSDTGAHISRIIGYLEVNYPNQITVEALANKIGLDRSYLSTLFKEKTGISPHAYLTSIRIKKAVQLMRDERYSVAEIAEAVGLQSENFARIFRRETGISPLEYRKKHM